jgi:hypothetical protein
MEKMNACKTLVGNPEGNRRLGRPGSERIILKWIQMEIGFGNMD